MNSRSEGINHSVSDVSDLSRPKAQRASRNKVISAGSQTDAATNTREQRLVTTVTEASFLLGISRSHGYRLIRRGQPRAIRLGRRILVPNRAIDDLLGGKAAGETDLVRQT